MNNDYKTMGRWFSKYDVRGFLKNHGTTEIDITDDDLLPIAKDIFRNDPEQTENIKLYEAITKFSECLIGRYGNNPVVQKTITTYTFVKGICMVYNLLVRLKNHNRRDRYKEVVDTINSVDVLLGNIPGNIDYTKLAAMLADMYMRSVIKEISDCEKEKSLELKTEETN